MKYEITETIVTSETGQAVKTYGIQCGNRVVNDISCDRAAILGLIENCNKYDLDPIHLHDIAQDFIS